MKPPFRWGCVNGPNGPEDCIEDSTGAKVPDSEVLRRLNAHEGLVRIAKLVKPNSANPEATLSALWEIFGKQIEAALKAAGEE